MTGILNAMQTLAQEFDPAVPTDAFYENPYPTYQALLEHDPVHRCPDGSYFLSKHADLRIVYRDPKTFSFEKTKLFRPLFGDSLLYEHHTTSLVFNDPPLHTHVRKAIGNALSQKTIIALQPRLHRSIAALLTQLEARPTFDLIEDYASIIPIEVIAHLLRIPHADRNRLRRWAVAILGGLEFNLSGEKLDHGNQCVAEFLDYLKYLIAARKNKLSDNDDIISRLIRWESEGFTLSDKQLCHQCIFLLNAGHDTTTNLIANGIHSLLCNPDQLSKLKQQPDLIHSAIEEFLRYESPVQLGNRETTAAVRIGGIEIPANTNLTLGIGAANRDPDVYERPDTLDIMRRPVDHHAFAGGIHLCAGLNIARLEARIAIPAILNRFPKLKPGGEAVRDKRARFRAFTSLPMSST